MNNPYSNEWGKINKLAKDIRTLLDKIEELRAKAAKIQEQIARIPYREDENGNDVNAGRRDALYAQLESINTLIEETNATRAQLSAEAMQLSDTYQTQAKAYDEKAQKAAGAKGGFDRLSGYRFGASTAVAAAKASGQREEHYQSYVRILQELSSAAQSAANGILVENGTQTVSERGKFINPNKIGPGNSTEMQDYFEQRRWKGAPGDSIRLTNNTENSALLSNLNMEGLPYQNGNPDFTSVSHAVVPVTSAGVATMLAADAMLAKRYGITAEEIAEYRKENGLEWRDDGTGTGYLVPKAISEEYNEGKTTEIEPSAPDALTAYMWAHNYGKDDYDKYSKDPEWEYLHRIAFPEYYESIQQELEKERKERIIRNLENEGIEYSKFCDFIVVPDAKADSFVFTGENVGNYRKYLEFQNQEFKERKIERPNEIKEVDSRLIEGVYISSSDIESPEGFWNMHVHSHESWDKITRQIPIVQAGIKAGLSVEELIKRDDDIGRCASTFFNKNNADPIEVVEIDGMYIFSGSGRHRIIMAQRYGIKIPVTIVTRYL